MGLAWKKKKATKNLGKKKKLCLRGGTEKERKKKGRGEGVGAKSERRGRRGGGGGGGEGVRRVGREMELPIDGQNDGARAF